MAATVGGSIALPESVFARMGEPLKSSQLTFFSPAQRQQTAMIAEAIIPRTDTPGAIDAGVPGWIEVIVKDCYSTEDQKTITDGLADITRACQKQHGKSIDQLSPDEQVAFLTTYHQNTLAEKRKAEKEHGRQPKTFLEQFKELTKFCFVNSEVGATQAFEYLPIPGKWVASMPLEPGQKAWAL